MSEIVKTNAYRCLGSCSNCPFSDNGEKIHLKKGDVDLIKEDLLLDDKSSFSCHKTIYGLDVNMEPTEEPQSPKMCHGAYQYLKEQNKPNLMMKIAASMGIDKL